MEKLSRNYHIKLQEMCDCYLETNFRKQLADMASGKSTDVEEDALKYLALAIMYTLTEKAKKLSFKKSKDSTKITIKAKEQKIELPLPSQDLIDKIIAITRAITHLEKDKGECPLVLGLKNDQLELHVKVKKDKEKESVKFAFPDLVT
jgi:hypothetical protein